jgi:hypothetical protein
VYVDLRTGGALFDWGKLPNTLIIAVSHFFGVALLPVKATMALPILPIVSLLYYIYSFNSTRFVLDIKEW